MPWCDTSTALFFSPHSPLFSCATTEKLDSASNPLQVQHKSASGSLHIRPPNSERVNLRERTHSLSLSARPGPSGDDVSKLKSKKSGKERTVRYIWFCCQCSTGPFTQVINPSCCDCDHRRCPYCKIEQVWQKD
ncbi:hypothetical protein BR93DRAFT_149671 [Coniochaeta sp. PMI_546]|nr:hypothetical protein BR93DRAFT_149671 [Coniochaeta sp. PMI_546]